ncbi:type 1 glutamine amidotransferase [Trichlorobacter lovleyi]|uniref:Glutamine amidotransferase class-I n=1 Tax=Trichlorobacter lovleyi (strain ATCC BAA-1151 / DSM 17278 / SZ) TaxID=398767 RepID=B3EAB5_TRIL1|nr:type 1 glutamine amidotransferase [Trichlorobacter lovleyi]ACD93943.1 glutamine amidotransferase class-I [Trichlorobacter lovleyi SZ]
MKVHVLQHVPFEGIGSIRLWLEKHGADVSYTRFFEDHDLPQMNNFDLLIVMGGPMSVNDELRITWLRSEKQLLREAIYHGVSVVGICLGAQLIASALGARVYKNTQKEIGWFQIESTQNEINTFNFPKKCNVFHWHGETFDLPSGAVCLARSAASENQAFQIGKNVIGLQFHLETTPESVNAILENCGSELIAGSYIQTESEMRALKCPSYEESNNLMEKVLSYVTRDLS